MRTDLIVRYSGLGCTSPQRTVSAPARSTAGGKKKGMGIMNGSPDGWAEKGTAAYWAKREAEQAALRLQFIKDGGIPPTRPDPRERLRHR